MAEVNDFFMRTLRDSSSRGVRVTPNGKTSPRSPPLTIINHCPTSKARPRDISIPPDLLANLQPEQRLVEEAAKKDVSSQKSTVVAPSSAPPRLASRSLVSSFTNNKRETTPLKEYQSPLGQIPESNIQRRHSTTLPQPQLESQVRVVPTSYHPQAIIPRLKRQGSFHGETAASRYLKAKNQALMASRNSSQSSGSPYRKCSEGDNSSSSCDTPTIMEETTRTSVFARSVRSEKSSRPTGTSGTRPLETESFPSCPRHIKHHSNRSPPLVLPKSASYSQLRSDMKKNKPREPGCSKPALKFGTLPRSFKISNAKPSSPSSEFYPSYGRSSLRLRRPRVGRSLWHVTSPVQHPDVALLADEKVWVTPLVSSQQQLCTCGDTREHVHLVKISEDLTLTDTRYFIDSGIEHDTGDEVSNEMLTPKPPANQSSYHQVVEQLFPKCTLGTKEEDKLEMVVQTIDTAKIRSHEVERRTAVETECDSGADSHDPSSPTFDELDDSEFLRTAIKRSRIRSVGALPFYGRLFAHDALSQTTADCPRFRPKCRTYSMEDIFAPHIRQGQVADKAPIEFLSVTNTDSCSSASQQRRRRASNMHLSYLDLLKSGSSRLWHLPSKSGSVDHHRLASGDRSAACRFSEAALALLM